MKHLVIVESPTKVKTIKRYLGKDYAVIASVGHIRDLPKSEKDAINIDDHFAPKYVISKDKQKVVDDIVQQAAAADHVILATDPDREGEAIAWHIQQAAKLKNPDRIVFHEITKEAVEEALKHPRKIDQSLRKSQEARRVLDRLFGYTLSKLIWTKVRYGLSAGRVQSPALRILMEREREIRKFKPVTYWELKSVFKREDGSEHIADVRQPLKKKVLLIPFSPKRKRPIGVLTLLRRKRRSGIRVRRLLPLHCSRQQIPYTAGLPLIPCVLRKNSTKLDKSPTCVPIQPVSQKLPILPLKSVSLMSMAIDITVTTSM